MILKNIVAKARVSVWPFLLIILSIIIIWRSYGPGTILSGWDTLHPEFDFSLYFQRILSVWQPHQGLGAAPSQAHVAELPRVIILWLFSKFVPMDLLRYGNILMMLILGPLGIYYLLQQVILKQSAKRNMASFIGGLVYLLNLGTLQHFYTPLEMFVTFYGFVGWLMLFYLQFIKSGSKKSLVWLILLILLIAPSAHTATLWYVFYGALFVYSLAYLWLKKANSLLIKRTGLSLLLILVINLFWILPNLYYVKNYSQDVMYSETHRLLSNEFFLRSEKRGTWKDLVMLTNFPFDWGVYDFNQKQYVDQMGPWIKHVELPFVWGWNILLFGFFLLGIFAAIKKKQNKLLAFLPVLFICVFFLINANWPFTFIYLWLRDHLSLFRETFRFPFTKFSLFYLLIYSLFIGNGVNYLLTKLKSRALVIYLTLCLMIGQTGLMWPAFEQTGYISKAMQVQIPKSYFNLFKYLKNQPNRRILSLPLHSEFGWVFHNWNYQGAGFLWFGLQQPLLDREFDRWHPVNEQAYREFSYALYTRDAPLFKKLLQKYQVGYILYDSSVVEPNSPKDQALYERETKELVAEIGNIHEVFQQQPISLFEVPETNENTQIKKLLNIGPKYKWNFIDQAYFEYGDYYSAENIKVDISYPIRTFLNREDKLSNNIDYEADTNSYYINYQLPGAKNSWQLNLPKFAQLEKEIYADLYAGIINNQGMIRLSYLLPNLVISPDYLIKFEQKEDFIISFNSQQYQIDVTKLPDNQWLFIDQVLIQARQENNINEQIFLPEIRNATLSGQTYPRFIYGKLSNEQLIFEANEIYGENIDEANSQRHLINLPEGDLLRFYSNNETISEDINLEMLSQENAYLIVVESKNLSSLPLRMCAFNLYSQRCDIYDQLSFGEKLHEDKFILPPMKIGQGYSLIFWNVAYGNIPTENLLKKVTIIPVPYMYLSSVKFTNPNQEKEQIFINNQAYDPGWHAYLNGRELKNHVLVNNWANGWVVPQGECANGNCQVKILFWPQYLEFAGFGLLVLALIWILTKKF